MKNIFLSKGISIIEILVVLAISALLIVVVLGPFQNFRRSQALVHSADGVISILNEARTRTVSALNGTNYSVRFESNRAILFPGNIYTSGSASNEYFYYANPVVLGVVTLGGGGVQITFDRLTGATDNHGTIEVLLPGGSSRIITVGPAGIISRN